MVGVGEGAGVAMGMSWKCGILTLPFGGAKGGSACDPATLTRGELERLTRRFTEEVLSIIGPRMDVMAPDLGTDEQTMAWIYDTYSMHVGYACPEIVTGKPVELGGCVGRREATGRGGVFCIMEALQELNLKPGESTAVLQGFGNVRSAGCHQVHQHGVQIAAVGGVIVLYFEWVQDIQQFLWSEEQVNLKLQELMLKAFHQVRFLARERKFTMRSAALSLGVQKVAKEKLRRGLFP